MKKYLTACLATALFFAAGMSAGAEVTGHVYYTDIKAYMKGELINSYNLGGETGIICEDLRWYYGFDVEWKPDTRELWVDDNVKVSQTYPIPEELDVKPDISQNVRNLPKDYYQAMDGTVGEIAKDVYATDIQAYLNGNPIRSYNIDGQTIIICEDLREFGYDVQWDETARTLTIWPIRELKTADSDLGRVVLSEDLTTNPRGMRHIKYPYTLEIDGQYVDLAVPQGVWRAWYQATMYVPLKATLEALGQTYTWDEATNTLTVTTKPPVFEAGATKLESGDGEPFDELYAVHMHITVDGEPFVVKSGPTTSSPTIAPPTRRVVEPVLYDGVVYIPLNAIADMIGYDCPAWDALISPTAS